MPLNGSPQIIVLPMAVIYGGLEVGALNRP